MIHKLSLIDPLAKIDDGVTIGPYSVIGPEVEIGKNSIIHSHVVIEGPTKIGKNNDSSINTLPDVHREYLSKNDLAYGDYGVKNYTTQLSDGIARMNSFYSKMNTMTHTIELCGDFQLKAGRKIKLLFPKSMEAETYKNFNDDDFEPEHLDLLML